MRRRQAHGFHRLTETLVRLEASARAENRRLWLQLKLPPPTYAALFGLDARTNALAAQLAAPPPPHSLLLSGAGGIGKTTLAHAALTRLIDAGQFEDIAWLSFDEPTAYPTLLARLARDLGYVSLASASLDELEGGLRVRLASAPALIMLDNVDYLQDFPALVSRLDSLVAPGRLLMAARQLPVSDLALPVMAVDPLERPDFAALLRDFARARRISRLRELPDDVVDAIYSAVGGNPLAGKLVVSQIEFLPLERVLANLATLPTMQGVGLFDWLFTATWEALGEDAHCAALAMCLLPPEGADWQDLLVMSGLAPGPLNRALEELVAGSLLDASGQPPRYAMHALARLFVEDQAQHPELVDVYRRMLHKAVTRARRARQTSEGPTGDARQGLLLLQQEARSGADADGLDDLIVRLAPAIHRAGLWAAWRDVLQRVANRQRDAGSQPDTLARTLLELGVTCRWLGEAGQAEQALGESIRLFGETGDFTGQAEAEVEIGQLYETTGQTAPAYEAYQRAVAAAQRHATRDLRRRALNGLAGLALHNERTDAALDLLQQALALDADRPDGRTLSNLGMAYLQAEDTARAIDCQQQALDAFEDDGALPEQARAHLRLGMAYHAGGRAADALHHLDAGLRLMQTLGDALGRARILTNLGAVHAGAERWQEALSVWREALDLQHQLGDAVGMAYTWYNLADLQWQLDHPAEARAALDQAAALAEQRELITLLASIRNHPARRG